MAGLNLPSFEDTLNSYSTAPAAPAGPTGYASSEGQGSGWFGSGLSSGWHQMLSELGSAGEAGGRIVGANDFANSAADWAADQRAKADMARNAQLEKAAWYDPEAMAYRVMQGVPTLVGALGAGTLGAMAAPEALGGAAVGGIAGTMLGMFPGSVGANVQRHEDEVGPLDHASAIRAAALGVPEAVIQGLLPAAIEGRLLTNASKGILKSALMGGAIGAPATAATEWATQQMGDPNRPMGERAQQVLDAAFHGGVLGGVTSGLLHPVFPAREIAKKPAATVSNDDMAKVVDQSMQPPGAVPQAVAAPGDMLKARMQQEAQRGQLIGPPAPQQGPVLPDLEAMRAGRPIARQPGDLDTRIAATAMRPTMGVGPQIGQRGPAGGPATFGKGQIVGGPNTFGSAVGRLAPHPDDIGPGHAPNLMSPELRARMDAMGRPVEGPGQPPPPEGPTFANGGPGEDGQNPVPFGRKPAQPAWSWEAARADLQKDKAWPKALKGPFNSADELTTTAIDNLSALFQAGKEPTKGPMLRAGQKLGLLDANGDPIGALADRITDAQKPPGVTAADEAAPDISGPRVPDQMPRDAIDPKHQGRWDWLEQQRKSLLGDNLSDPAVMQLLKQTSDLQNALPQKGQAMSGRGSAKKVDTQIGALEAQVKARTAQGKTPGQAPTVAKTAPAVGPDPSPAAATFAAKVRAAKAAKEAMRAGAAQPAGAIPATTLMQPTTKEAQVKAARKAKAAPASEPAPAPAPAPEPAAEKTFGKRKPATLKEAATATPPADMPPPVTAKDIPQDESYAREFAKQSARENGKTQDLSVTGKRTKERMALDAKRKAAEEANPQRLNIPTGGDEANRPAPAGEAAPRSYEGMTPDQITATKAAEIKYANNPQRPAIERDARYWEWLRQRGEPDDITAAELHKQQAGRLDDAMARLNEPAPKTPEQAAKLETGVQAARDRVLGEKMLAPKTEQARAKIAKQQAELVKDKAIKDRLADAQARMAAATQTGMGIEEAKQYLARAEKEANARKRVAMSDQHGPEVVEPPLAPTIDQAPDVGPQKELTGVDKRRFENGALKPPVVDLSELSGYARDGRRIQSDVRQHALQAELKAKLDLMDDSQEPITPVSPAIMRQLLAAKDKLTALERSGAILPRHAEFDTKEPRFQELLAQHRAQLDLVDRALRDHGMDGLKAIPRNYFGTDLWDEMTGHVTPQTERAMNGHAYAEGELENAAALSRGERPLIRYSQAPTQHDIDLRNVIDPDGSGQPTDMKSALAYLRDQGTSPWVREMAHQLHQYAGGTISFSDTPPAMSRELKPGQVIAGFHDPVANHTSIYDGAGMEQSILHEAAHAATQRAISADTPAAREITDIFNQVRSKLGDVYGAKDVSEFVAESFSNPTFQQTLKTLSTAKTDLWTCFKNAVFKALGMNDRVRTLYDDVMDSSNRLMGENIGQAAPTVNQLVTRGGQQFSEGSTQLGNALVRELKDKWSEVKDGLRGHVLGFETGDQLAWRAQKVQAAADFMGLQNHRTVRTDILAKTLVKAIDGVDALPQKAKDAWNRLAQRTVQGIDGFRPWRDHTWLANHPQLAELYQEHMTAQRDADILRRTPGGEQAWKYSVDANAAAMRVRNIYHADDFKAREYANETWHGFHNDPIREYESRTDLHDDPTAARAWGTARQAEMEKGLGVKANLLHQELNALMTAKAHNNQLPQNLRMTPEQYQDLMTKIGKVSDNEKTINSMLGSFQALRDKEMQGPYFHLGRDGNHFVSAHVITGPGGVPDDQALVRIMRAMDERGFKVQLMRGVTNDTIYARMHSQAQRDEMFTLMHELQKKGDISASQPISRGLAEDTSIYRTVGPQWMRQAIEALNATPPDYPPNVTAAQKAALDTAHEQQKRELTRSLMASLPETSITKLYQPRQDVQGFNPDMMHSYKASAVANSRGLSNLSLARELGAKAVEMTKQLEQLNQSTAISGNDLTATSQAVGEIVLRNKLYQAHVPSTMMDGVRRTVHAFQIGASPGYFFTLMSQIPTLTLPELAKTHGYVRSARALAGATNEALAVMRAVMGGADAVTFGLRREDLERAGIKPSTVDFVMNLAARGAFNQGAYTEAMTGHQVDSSYGNLLQKASVLGRYSEQFPRLLTALAARDLHAAQPGKAGGLSLEDFAYKKTMDSQFNWNPELNARQTTRSGMFGAMSPLINQFMGFQIRMTEKLYREFAQGFGKMANSKEEAAQSRKWLYGHAAAVTMLAGTLGAPMVGVAASVFDRLADWAGDRDDVDVTASYRTWLADSFGKEAGEAIARGLPRLAGVDFAHLGEGSIMPGSKMLEFASEKRKIEDAEKDWLKNMAGSSVGFLSNTAFAMRDLSNGDFMDAMIKMAPEALKGGIEAYKLGKYGFVDRNGEKLPITASSSDIMKKALGIDPAQEAEYDEEKKSAMGLQQMRALRSQNITRHLILAVNQQRPDDMRYWQSEAMQFTRDHPGMSNPLQDFERALTMHARNAAYARSMGTPIGVQPRDTVSRGMVRFGNLRNGDN